jgi:hypothetical protein
MVVEQKMFPFALEQPPGTLRGQAFWCAQRLKKDQALV